MSDWMKVTLFIIGVFALAGSYLTYFGFPEPGIVSIMVAVVFVLIDALFLGEILSEKNIMQRVGNLPYYIGWLILITFNAYLHQDGLVVLIRKIIPMTYDNAVTASVVAAFLLLMIRIFLVHEIRAMAVGYYNRSPKAEGE